MKNRDQDIKELVHFFNAGPLQSKPIRWNQCSLITNVPLFIQSHLDIVKGQNGNLRYAPYLDRLNELKLLLSRN